MFLVFQQKLLVKNYGSWNIFVESVAQPFRLCYYFIDYQTFS